MSAKKIILAINDLDFGGGQRTVVAEANELHRRGVSVFVLTTLAGAKLPLAAGLTIPKENIFHIPFRSLWDLRSYGMLFSLFRRLRPDAVVSNLFFTNTVTRIALLFLPSTRIVIREGNVPTEKSFAAQIVDALLSLRTQAVIGNSARVLRMLPFVFTKKVLLYNGIDAEFFKNADQGHRVRAELGLREDEVVIVSVGSLTKKKGHRYALAALAGLGERAEKARFLIAGDGALRTSLHQEAERAAPGRVLFIGARADIPGLLAASDIFLLPSLWEGMPNAALEALASGLPVVATDVGGIREIITTGKNGYLVPAADSAALAEALAPLIESPELRKRIGEAGRLAVSGLTWEKHVTALLEIL